MAKQKNRRAIVAISQLVDNDGKCVEKGIHLEAKRLFNGKIVKQEMDITLESFLLLYQAMDKFLSHTENQELIQKQLENENKF